jgi:hypothetical protein
MENKNLLLKITCSIAFVLISILLVYGIIQRRVSQTKEEEVLSSIVPLKECEIEVVKQREYARSCKPRSRKPKEIC